MQLMGVRYYLAYEEYPNSVADEHPDLEEIATSGPWRIYEVAGADLVQPLENEPAVLDDIEAPADWIEVNAAWYQDPSRWDVFYAADGPSTWQRIDSDESPEVRPVGETVEVSNVAAGQSSMSFDVSEVGTPVLVRMSYFPNWKVDGAEGPYRVSPNLMVVIPTDTHVELRYGWVPVDIVSYLFTLIGILGVVWLTRQPPVDMAVRSRRRPELVPAAEDEGSPAETEAGPALDGDADAGAGPAADADADAEGDAAAGEPAHEDTT